MKSKDYEAIAMILVSAFGAILFLAYSAIVGKAISTIDKQAQKVNTLYESYRKTVEENEILWTYIENVDTFKTLDDAIEYRDDLVEQLQFIDE